MASHVICGGCGTVLDHPDAVCRTCGSQSARRTHGSQAWGWGARPAADRAAAGVRPAARKSPVAAAVCAVVPGMGYVYLGQYHKAIGLVAVMGGLEAMGARLDLTVIGAAIGIPMGLGGLGVWLWSMLDSYQAARRTNIEYRPAG